MSATNYRNRWIDMLVNILGSVVIFLFGFWVTSSNANSKNLDNKLSKKADISYVDDKVDNSIREHEKVDAARYKGISDMFIIIREEQAEMRQDIKEILKNQK